MGKKCFVPNCKSGYKYWNYRPMFKGPKDPAMLEIWRSMIPRADRVLERCDCVCSKHFESHWITIKRKAGAAKQGRSRLLKGAFPTIFTDIATSKPCRVGSKHRKQLRPLLSGVDVTGGHVDVVTHVTPSESEPEILILLVETPSFSFSFLWDVVENVKLPAISWNYHKVDVDSGRYIAFHDVLPAKSRKLVVTKQVVFDESEMDDTGNCICKVYVLGSLVKRNDLSKWCCPNDTDEVQSLIMLLHSLPLCKGGPSRYSVVKTRPGSPGPINYYVDECEKWRHKKCTLLCDWGKTQCPQCTMV